MVSKINSSQRDRAGKIISKCGDFRKQLFLKITLINMMYGKVLLLLFTLFVIGEQYMGLAHRCEESSSSSEECECKIF